jgi:uncharacterized protein
MDLMTRKPGSRPRRLAATLLVAGLIGSAWAPVASGATPTDVFISEYLEGSSNNKAIEIYNGTGTPVDLGAGGYSLEQYANGSTTPQVPISLTGTINHGDVFVIAHSGAAAPILAAADQTLAALNFNGNDALVLRKGASVIDSIGQVGNDPGLLGWGADPLDTVDNTLRRRAEVSAGDTNPTDTFDPAVGYESYALDAADGLGSHTANTGADTGGVDAVVSIAAAAACLELSTTSIDFGNLTLGAQDQPATPAITLTNCSSFGEDLFARGTNASGTAAAWNLVDSGATCADTLGLDSYRLNLATAALAAPLGLSTTNKPVQSLTAGDDVDHVARIHTACPGSTGAGVVMSMQIHYLVTAE